MGASSRRRSGAAPTRSSCSTRSRKRTRTSSTFLQVLDEGHLTDSFGRKVDFKNAVVIMTSNIGARFIDKGGVGLGFQKPDVAEAHKKMEASIRSELKHTFNPEFLNRVDGLSSSTR